MEPAKPNTPQAENKLHFLDYWRIIRIRMTVILAVFLLVAITTTAVTFMLPKSYMSLVRMQVEKEASSILPLLGIRDSSGGIDPFFIQTEFEKITSQSVLDPVVLDPGLNLQRRWAKDMGIEGSLKPEEARAILKGKVDVRQFRNTAIIEIRVYDKNAKEAADIANKIAEVYRQGRLTFKQELSKAGVEALKARLDVQNKTVDDLQKTVDDYREKYGISDVDIGGGMPASLLEPEVVRTLEGQRLQAENAYITANTLLERLRSLKKTSPEKLRNALPTALPDEGLSKLLVDLMNAEQNYTMTIKELGQENPTVQKSIAVIKKINTQIDERIDGILDGLQARVDQQKNTMDTIKTKFDEAKTNDVVNLKQYRPYFLARRDLDTQQRIRDNLQFRIIQETVDKSLLSPASVVQIIDKAEASTQPVRPNIPVNITLGILVGLVMGIGLAFFIEYLDTSVKTIDDVERTLQAPVIGVIPQNVGTLLEEGPESPHAEAYRVLRTNLLFSRKKPDANTITVVSGGAGEGKSTTIFNLATTFAQGGQRVLIVDSDLRRPSLHKFLNVSNSLGLTNYLLKQNTLEEVIQTTPLPTLHFLASGKLPSSSMGILNSVAMKEFIQEIKKRYDFIFFDSPPIMGVSDASVLASEVDLALLVVQYRKYPQLMTIRAKQMVEKVGGNLLGVVLNNINISQDSYYYYYSGYYYDYYYSKHDEEDGTKKNGESKKSTGRGVDLKQKY